MFDSRPNRFLKLVRSFIQRVIFKLEKICAIRGETTKNFTKFAFQIKKTKHENKSKIRN